MTKFDIALNPNYCFSFSLMEKSSKYHLSPEELTQEASLVREAQKNPIKFEALYNKYYDPIFHFIYQRIEDKTLAFDLTSQVFLKAMVKLKDFEFKGVPFSSWLYRIAQNELLQFFRKNKHLRTINIETAKLKEIEEDLVEGGMEQMENHLIEGLQNLEANEVEIIEMRFFDQLPFKTIGEIIGTTENNAKVKTYRILEKLKKVILKKVSKHEQI